MSIKVKGIRKWYGQQEALKGVDFEIQSGKIVGFLGPNGAGKSTMMKILSGATHADEGLVEIQGFPFSAGDLAIHKRIGYLPENNPLYSDQYVREYLNFCAQLYKVPNPKERIEEVLQMTGLVQEAHKMIGQLSKGYRQRVGLAQAILHDPEVLILDEPTTGLDPKQLTSIRQLIRDLGRNKTVLFSSHILQEVEALCEEVLLLHQGHLVADFSLRNWRENFPDANSLEDVFIRLTQD